MKTKTLLATLALAILGLGSCSNEPTDGPTNDAKESYVDATSKSTWHYFSLADNKVVGTGEESEADNQKWAARTDWDLAINRYTIRTNSGAATTSGAQGGVFTFSASTSFNSVSELPSGAIFVADKAVTSEGMGGTTTIVKSEAAVILFKKNEDGSTVMPPVYLQAPVYLFRTADAKSYYKVQFTQYQDANKITGHVKFYSAPIK